MKLKCLGLVGEAILDRSNFSQHLIIHVILANSGTHFALHAFLDSFPRKISYISLWLPYIRSLSSGWKHHYASVNREVLLEVNCFRQENYARNKSCLSLKDLSSLCFWDFLGCRNMYWFSTGSLVRVCSGVSSVTLVICPSFAHLYLACESEPN